MFALALRVGCTVDELLHRLSSRELAEWLAYFDLGDPWLDLQEQQKADLRTGVIGATLANLLGNGKKRYRPSEFSPQWSVEGEQKPRQSTDEMKRAAMRSVAAFKRKR